MSSLYNKILEQTGLNFTGRINVQDKLSSQHLGQVSLKEGQLNAAEFKNIHGYRGLLAAVISDQENF